MSWKNDNHGLVVYGQEVKLYSGSHTWAMKLSQLASQTGIVRICTYSLPDINYVQGLFHKRPYDIEMICHSKFAERALQIKNLFPLIRIGTHDEIHAKVCLISPATVYIGSANFGHSNWHEVNIGIRSPKAHDHYVKIWDYLMSQSQEVL